MRGICGDERHGGEGDVHEDPHEEAAQLKGCRGCGESVEEFVGHCETPTKYDAEVRGRGVLFS